MSKWIEIDEDSTVSLEADPVLSSLKRKAGVDQSILEHTQFAHVGDTKHPFVSGKIRGEVRNNMLSLLYAGKLPYGELEDTLANYGYGLPVIREVFEEVTGVDPMRVQFMRNEDVKNTPANIPCYNLGWGEAKGKNAGSYFIMPTANLYTVFHQASDTERAEKSNHLRVCDALEAMGKLVKSVHRYDMPAMEEAEAFKVAKENVSSSGYMKVANFLYTLERSARLDAISANRAITDAIASGNITDEEGRRLFMVYAAEENEVVTPDHVEEKGEKGDKELGEEQNKKVFDELKKKTPQQMFTESIPDRDDEIISEHTRNVLSYVKNRNSDMMDFEVDVKKYVYEKREGDKVMVTTNPETGKAAGPARATVSTILQVKDKTLPEGDNVKFALAVFFVGPDGEITTSDSIKGEDDLIYGFTEDGLGKYFAKNRGSI
jgi:hypothetical protein